MLDLEMSTLVVVVDGDGERPLGGVLTDHELLEEVEDLARLGQLVEPQLGGLGELLLDDLVAQVDALVADVDPRPGDELLDLFLALATERALEQVAAVSDACHEAILPVGGAQLRRRYPFAVSAAPIEQRCRAVVTGVPPRADKPG
jgi:hypothetical protein